MIRMIAMIVAGWAALSAPPAVAQGSPRAAADVLLAADRAFSAASATTDVVAGLTAMFAPDVIMPAPPGRLHRGTADVTASLRANPDNLDGRVTWTPVRVGLSADGEHGFTFGFMTQVRTNGTTLSLKYMAYWVKGASGWRVAGYKRARRPEGNAVGAPMTPLVPPDLVPAVLNEARRQMLERGLAEAERAFSDEAQTIGLGAAFTRWGSATAVNMGGPDNAEYVVGAAAIGRSVGAGAPGTTSPVEWSTNVALVASSGDLGISFGYIRPHAARADAAVPQGQPFFTIWHRASPTAPWRYIAE